ncbi:hypothetical protein [Rhodohalobacter sp. 614A]|uniref:hypothetical protein n=1 Tax=Rhodohalobacter sp. 614A TaxID=2908649 RepID=UPI001F27DB58|nr:hypothetical protein [Rhodohalobacter sp. 614A]
MRVIFITIISFVIILFGCSTAKEASIEGLEVIQANFRHWSEAPLVQSDVRERGTDLALIVNGLPDGANPEYIIFRKKKSFPAEITDTTENGVRIQARIIMRSSVLAETSETVDKSDRLVFRNADGKSSYIEIEEWSRMDE